MDATAVQPRPAWIAGRLEQGPTSAVVTHPYDGSEVASAAVPGPEQIERAISSAVTATSDLRDVQTRLDALVHTAHAMKSRSEELAEILTAECGRPIMWTKLEVAQAISAFKTAADAIHQGWSNLRQQDLSSGSGLTVSQRSPRGPILSLPSAGFHFRSAATKISAALAVGAPFLLAPNTNTPLSALVLGEILATTNLPAGAFSILPLGEKGIAELVVDARLPVVWLSGPAAANAELARLAPDKRFVLDPGGDMASVIFNDWQDLPQAAQYLAKLAAYHAGQPRAVVQHIFAERQIAEKFLPSMQNSINELSIGNPYDPEVAVSPAADEGAAEPIAVWFKETDTSTWHIESAQSHVILSIVDDPTHAFSAINDLTSCYQAKIFARNIDLAFRSAAELNVNTIVVGDEEIASQQNELNIHRAELAEKMIELTSSRVTIFSGMKL